MDKIVSLPSSKTAERQKRQHPQLSSAEGKQLDHGQDLEVMLQLLRGLQAHYRTAASELQQHAWKMEKTDNRITCMRNQELPWCHAHHKSKNRK